MKKITIEYYCDICNQKTNNEEQKTPVIFLTEQNEGRSCYPYLVQDNIVLCDKCMDKMLNQGIFIFAEGAMGSNKYFFKERSDK